MKKLLLLIAILLLPSTVSAARIWSSGAELQSVTALVEYQVISGSPAISTSVKRSGEASVHIASMSSGTREGVLQRVNTGFSQYFVRFYLRVDTCPTADNMIFKAVEGVAFTSSNSLNLRLTSACELELYNNTTQIGSASAALSTGTFYRVEVRYDQDPAPGDQNLYARIDGVDFASSEVEDLVFGLESLVFGGNLNAEAQTQGVWYFDDMAFNDTSGTAQTSWPGAGSIVHMQPNATGDNSDGTLAGTAAAATGWESLDEVTPNNGTDFVQFTNTAHIIDVNTESSADAGIGSSDTVTLVQVGLTWGMASAASGNSRLRIKSQAAGTTALGTLTANAVATTTAWHFNDDTTPRNYKLTQYVDPQAGGAWTTALLDSMQIGIQTTDVTPNPEFTTLWALVEYVPSDAPPPAVVNTKVRVTVWGRLQILGGRFIIF